LIFSREAQFAISRALQTLFAEFEMRPVQADLDRDVATIKAKIRVDA